MAISELEFVDDLGGRGCPVCGMEDEEVGEPRYQGWGFEIPCSCDRCGSVWRKQYPLAGYDLLEERHDHETQERENG